MKKISYQFTLLLSLLFCLQLVACGMQGDLYLPDEQPKDITQ